jgi:hypothetical protein
MMFPWWSPTPKKTKNPLQARRRRITLNLEALEARDCPSASTRDVAAAAPDGPASGPALVTAADPAVLSLPVAASPKGTATVSGAPPAGGPTSGNVTAKPPKIVNFQVINNGNNNWTFTGQVQGPDTEGLLVTLAGIPSLDDNGASATVQADGSFSYTVTLRTGETGGVTADCTDWWGQASNEATAYVTG